MKIPSAGTPVSLLDLLRAFLPKGGLEDLQNALCNRYGVTWCGLTGSGTSAIYAVLRTFKRHSERTEVVLPAYTAPSLILPIRKAGLTPVLSEISPETLNADPPELLDRAGPNTLCVMPVHMFGLPTDLPALKEQLKDSGTFTLEDAASAMGTRFADREVGASCDVGVFSFNRGKNLSTYTGGVILTSREDLVADLEAAIGEYPVPGFGLSLKMRAFVAALALIVRPLGYTLLSPIAERFKYKELHTDFHTRAYTPFQARLGCSLLKKLEKLSQKRLKNGRFLHRELSNIDGIRLPQILETGDPAYNQFPVLLPDEQTRTAVHTAILETGLEATLLYPDPIHRIFPDIWDGQGPDPFPNATAVSKRLLLIPAHPLVPRSALERAVKAVEKTLK